VTLNNPEFIGKAIIISAPSGSGKTTIAKSLLANNSDLKFSISACTRSQREGKEVNGIDYYFITNDEFQKNIRDDKFIEWEEVYEGMYYGTLKSEVKRIWSEGKHILFDVDVKGGIKLKEYFGDNALAIFIKVPSLKVIEERLSQRKTESAETLRIRLEKIKYEMSFEDEFDVSVLNESIDKATKEAIDLTEKFLTK